MTDTGGRLPFEGSAHIESIVLGLFRKYGIRTFVETGTQRGATSLWASNHIPNVITIEADKAYFEEAKKALAGSGVTQLFGDSAKVLRSLEFKKGERVFFFLDAHGCNIGGTPLISELWAIQRAICAYEIKAVIGIHDAQVPGRPELGYDVYENASLDAAFIQSALIGNGFGEWIIGYNSVADGAARGFCYVVPK
jgi:hypothetical protein